MREESPEQQLANDLLDWMNPAPLEKHSTQSNGHAAVAPPPLTDEQIIERCRAGKSAAKFSDLFDAGDVSAYDDDDSGADYGLIGILKHHTRDAAQIERIMLRSALRRGKWQDDRVGQTYLRYSIDRSLHPDGAGSGSFSSFHSPIGGGDDENHDSEIKWFYELGEPKEREYIIEKVGVKGYPIVCFGAGGVAKSFTMLAAGIAIASASGVDEWLGLRVLEHGYVLYLDLELDLDEQHRRVRDLCNGMRVPIPKRLAYLSGVGISTEAAFEDVYAFAREYEPVAVIIDSTGMAMVGDMDKAKDVIAFYRRYVEPLRRMGVTPLLVDHEGKRQAGEKHKDKSPIGSVYKTNNSRSVLQFILEEYDEENSALDIKVHQHKTNFTPIKPFGVRITFADKNVSITTRELPDEELIDEERLPVRDRILAALKIEPMTVSDLENHTGAVAGTIYNNLSHLITDELVIEAGYRGRKKLYDLRPSRDEKGEEFVTSDEREKDEKEGGSFSSSSSPPIGESDDENKNETQARSTGSKEVQARGAGLQDKPTVSELFANPPGWLPGQLEVYWENPRRHLKPLCVSVAAAVLGDGLRWEEVREEVRKEVGACPPERLKTTTLYTSYWNNPRLKKPPLDRVLKIGISRRCPHWGVNHVSLAEEPFAPPQHLLDAWKESEKTPEDERRFEKGYREHLDAYGIDAIRERLEEVMGSADVAMLLCYEKDKFCHRRVFADWYQEQTGEVIEEVPRGAEAL